MDVVPSNAELAKVIKELEERIAKLEESLKAKKAGRPKKS